MTVPDGVRRAVIAATILAGLLLLGGQLGPVTFQSSRTASAAALATVALAGVRLRGGRASALACWAGVVIVALAPTAPVALLAYVCVVAVAGANANTGVWAVPSGLPQTCLAVVCVWLLPEFLPQSRAVGEGLTAAARAYILSATGEVRELSPTALGCPPVFAAAAYLVWRWRAAGSHWRPITVVLLVVGWFLVLPLVILPASAGALANFRRGTHSGVAWAACAIAAEALLAVAPLALTDPGRGLRATVALACLLAGLMLSGTTLPMAPAERSLLIHNRGGLDWDRPVWGRFGPFSGGMFGLLPVNAQASGYRVEVLDRDEVRPEDLVGFQTLVLINSPKRWGGDELRAVRDFVAAGGSLLVLGDHTDVFGLMEGFNTLLSGFGIQFEFDCAYHARRTWRGCCVAAPDAVSGDWDLEHAGVAIGASLRLEGDARALLTGRYAHSDHGLRENVVGSFLGNYSYDAPERLGDTVLVATATFGRGRVVVFGDTSPFQSGSDYSFLHTVGPVFELLSRPTHPLDRPGPRAVAAFLLAALIAAGWVGRVGNAATATAAATLCFGLATGWFVSGPHLRRPTPVDTDCFLLDQSHLPATGHYEAGVNPTGPLSTSLLRAGLRPVGLLDWDAATLARARGVGFIAPRRRFKPREIDDLLRFEEAGGVVLVAAGEPDCAAARPLLHAHGVDIEARPLGTVPAGASQKDRPRFLDAWPVVDVAGRDLSEVPEVDVIYRTQGHVCAAYCRRGRGGLLLFADTRFFSTMNVEDTWGHWEGNLALLHDIFNRYLRTDPGAVRPLFPSPKKPD